MLKTFQIKSFLIHTFEQMDFKSIFKFSAHFFTIKYGREELN